MTPRNPNTGQWTFDSPSGAASATTPGMPEPGPAPHMMADPLPILDFNPEPSPCQCVDVTAVSTPPGYAGPCATNPTTPLQDFGQVMGETAGKVMPQQSAGDTDDA